MQSCANLYILDRVDEEFFDLAVVEGGQLFLHLHELLRSVLLVLHGRHALEAFTADALHTWRRMDPLHGVKPVFELLVNRLDLLLKRVVNCKLAARASVVLRNWWHRPTHAHLLLVVLNESWFHHVYAMLALNFLAVVHKEGFVASQLLLDWLNWDLVDCASDLKGLHGRHQFLGDVEDVFGKESPL